MGAKVMVVWDFSPFLFPWVSSSSVAEPMDETWQ